MPWAMFGQARGHQKKSTALNTARTGSISAFQLDQQFGSFGFGSGLSETIATLPGGWDLAHAIRLGIKLFAELGANSQALSGSQVDSPCSCRAIFESAPVAMLQSRLSHDFAPVHRLALAFGHACRTIR